MRLPTAVLLSLPLAFAFAGSASAVTVTTGAGYIPVVKNVVAACRAQGVPAQESYGGNIGQMLAQISSGSGVNVVITDKTTLAKLKTPVKFSVQQPLGVTPLVVVWKKGLDIRSTDDLAAASVKSVAIPDPQAAVYGRAGNEWIAAQSASSAIRAKLMQVSTVPQVASYVARGEVDAGFVNVQAAKKNLKNLGGMMVLKTGYTPVELVAAVIDGDEKAPEVKAFLTCLQSASAREVLKKAGVAAQ